MRSANDLLSSSGSYLLILDNARKQNIEVGRLGQLAISPGYFVYVGSAFGPGGIRARVGRHFRDDKKLRWHIDYLAAHAQAKEAWLEYSELRREHDWARALTAADALVAIPGFGCSDCACGSHLFYCRRQPSRLLAGRLDGELLTYCP